MQHINSMANKKAVAEILITTPPKARHRVSHPCQAQVTDKLGKYVQRVGEAGLGDFVSKRQEIGNLVALEDLPHLAPGTLLQ